MLLPWASIPVRLPDVTRKRGRGFYMQANPGAACRAATKATVATNRKGEVMVMVGRLCAGILLGILLAGLARAQISSVATATAPTTPNAAVPIRVKVVVVAMFERGEDTGDAPGEYQFWVEREKLDNIIPMPAGYHHVRMNKDGVLAMLTGVGTARAAASVMALGLDPRFDFSKAYWIVAGIGGGDPADVSLGSAIWADRVIDSDLAYEIDAREIPKDWPTGYVPLNRATPYEQPARSGLDGEMYTLNPQLVGWAFQLTKDTPLADSDTIRASRSHYVGFPNAMKPPFVAR